MPQLENTSTTTAEPACSRADTPSALPACCKEDPAQPNWTENEREERKVQGNEELDPRFMWRSFDSKFSVQLTGRMLMSPRKVDEGSDNRGIIGSEEVLMSLFESVLCSVFWVFFNFLFCIEV